MTDAKMSESMSPELLRVAERAQRDPEARFFSLAYLIDVAALGRAYQRLRKGAAVGVDGVSVEDYGQALEGNLQDLHLRMKSGRYRHQPIRRIHIPKEKGKTRPIGVSTVEDKVVQGALREVLEAVYEQDFMDCSHGFRPGRRAHDALRSLDRTVYAGEVNWVLEADIQSFFDSIDRKKLLDLIQERVPDGSIRRLVGKCLHVGVLDGAEMSKPDEGTAQGSIISPLLGNIYLHYALDLWFEREVKPCLRGKAHLVRYADDFVIGFEREDDARRVEKVLGKRMKKFGLSLHPDKTRLFPFGRPPSGKQSGKGPETFDFLGFTLFWARTRRGRWQMAMKTRRDRVRRAILSVSEWCRTHRHWSVPRQHETLCRKLQGHLNYFGVNGNKRSLKTVLHQATRSWKKWLCRRSQRSRLTWERFADLLRDFPLPKPRVVVQIWGR